MFSKPVIEAPGKLTTRQQLADLAAFAWAAGGLLVAGLLAVVGLRSQHDFIRVVGRFDVQAIERSRRWVADLRAREAELAAAAAATRLPRATRWHRALAVGTVAAASWWPLLV